MERPTRMKYRPKVYTASRLDRAPLWHSLTIDPDWDFVEWTASWIHCPWVTGAAEGPPDYLTLWSADILDVKRSDFTIVLGDEGLRGALIEAGCSIGNGIRVLAVEVDPDHSWTHHSLVTRLDSLEEARMYLFRYTIMIPRRRRMEDE